MVEPSLLRKLKKAYHVLKCIQILLLVLLSIWCVYGIITQKLFFAVMLFVNGYYLIVHFGIFSLNIRNTVLQEEVMILWMFIPIYGILMVSLWPDFNVLMKTNSSESQYHGESDKLQNATQIDEVNFTFPLRNITNKNESLWEATKNLSHNVIKRATEEFYFNNERDPEFLILYFTILVTILLFVIFQGVLLIIAWIINKQISQELEANASPQNEEEIPMLPGAPVNENLELEQDPGEGPSSKPPQPLQNVLTLGKHKFSKYKALKPMEDIDEENSDSLAKAGPSKAFEELRTPPIEMEKSSLNLSKTAASSGKGDSLQPRSGVGTLLKDVKEASSKASEEIRTAPLEMEKSSINLSTAAASSDEGDSLQPRSGVGTLLKDVKEASSKASEVLRTPPLEMEKSSINLSTAAAISGEGDSLQSRSGVGALLKDVTEASSQEDLSEYLPSNGIKF